MRKYKLLYFVSEDEYFLSHKIEQAKFALKNNFEVLVLCKFSQNQEIIKSHGFKTQNINLDRKSLNPFKEIICLLKLFTIITRYSPDIIQSVALKPILYTSIVSLFNPSTMANLSSSVLRGGDNFKNVLKSPMSFSFNDKLFIETPHENFKNCFFDLIMSTDFDDEICDI